MVRKMNSFVKMVKDAQAYYELPIWIAITMVFVFYVGMFCSGLGAFQTMYFGLGIFAAAIFFELMTELGTALIRYKIGYKLEKEMKNAK